ncbi:MAG TPA: transcription antitermination factor NusB [Vicinamibacterales bacterium]|nr:transcription antitermination factor NusB [Vicinamibacterales bacterium]
MSTPRHQAREAALRSLYFWEIGQTDPARALETYFEVHQPDAPPAVREFAQTLVLGTAADVASLDVLIQKHSEHWRLDRLAVIDRLILRLGAWELQHAGDTPHAVILNEALELARTFSTDDAVRFVNGVLDSIRKSLSV